MFVAFLAILAKQASKRSALIEIRDPSLKEGQYRAQHVPNVNKSATFALIIERLMLFINLALAGTVFLSLKNTDDVPIAGPCLSGCRCLVYLPHGPCDPRSGVADHAINWNPRSRNKIIDQGLRGHEDRTETPVRRGSTIARIRDEVGDCVREAAEKNGRAYAIMYVPPPVPSG